MSYTALFDANVLYPAPIRDILLQLAVTDLFRGRWTDEIHDEWIDALLRQEPHRQRAALERTRDLMNQAVRDCLITDYQSLMPALLLPDKNDRHVLAAAIVGRCDVIVTRNLKDFPEPLLAPFGIKANHPDDFLCAHLQIAPGLFCEAIQKVRMRLKKPSYTVQEYLAILAQQGLTATVGELKLFASLI